MRPRGENVNRKKKDLFVIDQDEERESKNFRYDLIIINAYFFFEWKIYNCSSGVSNWELESSSKFHRITPLVVSLNDSN